MGADLMARLKPVPDPFSFAKKCKLVDCQGSHIWEDLDGRKFLCEGPVW